MASYKPEDLDSGTFRAKEGDRVQPFAVGVEQFYLEYSAPAGALYGGWWCQGPIHRPGNYGLVEGSPGQWQSRAWEEEGLARGGPFHETSQAAVERLVSATKA